MYVAVLHQWEQSLWGTIDRCRSDAVALSQCNYALRRLKADDYEITS